MFLPMIKKFLPYILITVVVATLILGPFPFGVQKAHAEFWDDMWKNAKEGVAILVAHSLYIAVFTPSAGLLWVSGQFFNITTAFSINNKAFNAGMVSDGWMISRDVANLFFIFILLYIAIATILQLSGYGIKELLVTVIIIALLVNFSLLITKVIIDSSNILALEFYNAMTVDGGQITTVLFGDKNNPPRDISAAFINGFNPQKLLGSSNFQKIINEGPIDTTVNTILVLLFSSIICLIATFILFAASVLFIIRTVILWILMILAPLAFLFMVLPATSGYAKQWWKKLFEQAFFAPAFLFMFYLVVKMINSGFIGKSISDAQYADTGLLGGATQTFSSVLSVLIPFSILAILLVASLVVAKQMGAVGASTMQSWGQSAKKWGQGQAGKISRRGAGWAAERMLDKGDEEGKDKRGRVARWGGALADKIPFANRGLAKLSGMREQENKKRQKEWEKQYGSYSKAGLSAMLESRTLIDTAKRKAIEDILTKRKAGDEQKGVDNAWYKENENRNFDEEIINHEKEIARLDIESRTALSNEDKAKFGIEKRLKMRKVKELEKAKERREKIKNKKLGLETSYEERIKKLEEGGGEAKPAPASTPKT